MVPDDQLPPPTEPDFPTGKQTEIFSIDNPPPDEIHPAVSGFLACLPLAIVAGLAAAYWPSGAYGLKEEALTALFYLLPVLSGVLAVPIHYFNHPNPRPNLWKCSVWIWTWSLLFLAFSGLLVRSDLASDAIIGFPFIFPVHFLYVLLALVGLGIGEFRLGLRRGWKRWWTPAEWRLNTRQSALALLVLLLVQLATKCHF